MKWGVHLPQLGRRLDGPTLAEFARGVEAAGAHSVWVSDHVCWPAEVESRYPYTPDGRFPAPYGVGWLDPIATLLFVAATTLQVRLGTTVLILPYRPPVATAKQLATLDVLSGGRLILGAGVGWMREEAQVLGMPWDRRGARSDEQLELFEKLFYEDEPSYAGQFYRLPRVRFEPKPLQARVPVWIGGASPAAFERVARFGDGFHAAFQPRGELESAWAEVRRACERRGRDPREIEFSVRLYLDPEGVMDPELSIAGDAARMRRTVEILEKLGVGHVLLDPVAPGGALDGRLPAFERFMREVGARSAGAPRR